MKYNIIKQDTLHKLSHENFNVLHICHSKYLYNNTVNGHLRFYTMYQKYSIKSLLYILSQIFIYF